MFHRKAAIKRRMCFHSWIEPERSRRILRGNRKAISLLRHLKKAQPEACLWAAGKDAFTDAH